MKILLYGYGNPGRQDDALGAKFIEKIETWINENGFDNIETDTNYQLNIEDAATIADKDLVIFIDATIEEIETIKFTKVEPNDSTIEFTMHAVSAAFVVDLCQKIYNKTPEAYLLHIRGYEWELIDGLTQKASENLDLAIEFIKEKIKTTF